MGTVMCHQGHLADGDPLVEVGRKDITAHVNFTAMALAAQEAGMQVLGYTTRRTFSSTAVCYQNGAASRKQSGRQRPN